MVRRDVYRQTFDEDVSRSTDGDCPECDGHVVTNTNETVCADCGLVIEAEKIDEGRSGARSKTAT